MIRTPPLAVLAGAPTAIAYLGNSVTAQRAGYRERLHDRLCRHSGHHHRAINAGFGGVGAIGSVCTMDRTVVAHRPRLCFIECLTGDIGVGSHPHGAAAIEGMIAKLDAIGCAVCILLLPRAGMESDDAHLLVERYRRIARHCRVPLVDLLDRWPDLELMLRDGVHTSEYGAESFADAILAALCHMAPIVAPEKKRLFTEDFSSATTLPVSAAAVGRSGLFRLHLPYRVLVPGERLTLSYQDKFLVGLLVLVGPYAGTITIGDVKHDLRDRWSHYERLHAYVLHEELLPGLPWTIAPVQKDSELRLAGMLTRSVPQRLV